MSAGGTAHALEGRETHAEGPRVAVGKGNPMFRRILVPVDLTPKNLRAVEVACDLARQSGGEVELLHVIETLDLPFEELRDFYDRLQAQATDRLKPSLAVLEEAGVRVSGHILYGKRHEKILEFASEKSVDLIVLDSHRVEPGWLV